MRVLGVDPGLTRCGIGVVDSLPGRRAELVAVGVAMSPAALSVDQRLLQIATELDTWMDAHVPDVVAVERVFAQHNVSTVMGTAQVAGLAMLAAARRGVPVAMHTPSEVKAAVTGSGRAPKEQVQRMVANILGLAEVPRPADAADALAIAICHLWRPSAIMDKAERFAQTPAQRAWAAAEQAARRAKGTR
ncbi:Holliday junction endonuclease RuvC [Sanguibacter gelidistatuariae]|uniref:Crossover junction endodeoxyribonuclease RuvC n=1 Tax=Sanguibacter gelidistatuariae TaxID=1814289 RepID=A0A1G6JVS0_9MICO|nr:crossover junction endodeoxyribonuclease RuvC [Sanguibacter gelidistatuariae]SDC22869.1 Holliday junction endonuclease RuvC [Sanguibacter gelidistatuariae]